MSKRCRRSKINCGMFLACVATPPRSCTAFIVVNVRGSRIAFEFRVSSRQLVGLVEPSQSQGWGVGPASQALSYLLVEYDWPVARVLGLRPSILFRRRRFKVERRGWPLYNCPTDPVDYLAAAVGPYSVAGPACILDLHLT